MSIATMGVNRPDWLVEGSSSSRLAIGARFFAMKTIWYSDTQNLLNKPSLHF
jgi:hypothetical protein